MYAFSEMTFAPTGAMACHAPAYLNAVAVTGGFAPVAMDTAFVWADLACGDGMSAAIVAAAFPQAEVYAVGKGERGQFFAKAAGLSNITWLSGSVADLKDDALPPLDYAVWDGGLADIDPDAHARAFVNAAAAVKPGGLLLVGYHAQPGFAAMQPLRDVVQAVTRAHAKAPVSRLREALAWLDTTNVDGLGYLAEHSGVRQRLAAYADLPSDVAVQELFSPHLKPFHFAEVREAVAPYGLHFAGNAALHLNMVDTAVPAELQHTLNGVQSRNELETVRDVMRNAFYRRDVYVKGDQVETLDAFWALHDGLVVMLASDVTEVDFGGFTVDFSGFPFSTLREGLADGPKSVRDIPDLMPGLAREAVRLGLAGGWVVPCCGAAQSEPVADAPAIRVPEALNRVILAKAANFDFGVPLASKVLGGVTMLSQDVALVLGAIAATACAQDDAEDAVLAHLLTALDVPQDDTRAQDGMRTMVREALARLTPEQLDAWAGLGLISS